LSIVASLSMIMSLSIIIFWSSIMTSDCFAFDFFDVKFDVKRSFNFSSSTRYRYRDCRFVSCVNFINSSSRLKNDSIVDFIFLKYFIVDWSSFVKIQSNSKSIRSVKQQWSEDFLLRTIQSMQHDTLRHFQRFREKIFDRAFTNRSHRVKRKEVKISADLKFSFD
jgi:hypothetical protein